MITHVKDSGVCVQLVTTDGERTQKIVLVAYVSHHLSITIQCQTNLTPDIMPSKSSRSESDVGVKK